MPPAIPKMHLINIRLYVVAVYQGTMVGSGHVLLIFFTFGNDRLCSDNLIIADSFLPFKNSCPILYRNFVNNGSLVLRQPVANYLVYDLYSRSLSGGPG